MGKFGLVAMKAAIDLSAGKAPTEIRLLRAGPNDSDYGVFTFDELAAAMVMANFRLKGIPRLFADWNHGMIPEYPGAPISREKGASSCSFIPEVPDGELWATDIIWSDQGREDVESLAYNLFSPAFHYMTGDDGVRRPDELVNFALVNIAGLDDIKPLLAAIGRRENNEMDYEKIYGETKAELATARDRIRELEGARGEIAALSAALGTPEAPHAERVAALRALASFRAESLKILGGVAPEAGIAALRSVKADADKASTLEMEKVEREIVRLRGEFDTLLEGAVKDGKLDPSERPEFERDMTIHTDGKLTDAVVGSARRQIARLRAKVQTEGSHARPPTDADPAASAATKQVASLMGYDAGDVALFKSDPAAWEKKKREEIEKKRIAAGGRPAA